MAGVADYTNRKAIGVVLSGMLVDSFKGIRRISEVGGLTIAQEPSSCLHSATVNRTISEGTIGVIVRSGVMLEHIRSYINGFQD